MSDTCVSMESLYPHNDTANLSSFFYNNRIDKLSPPYISFSLFPL